MTKNETTLIEWFLDDKDLQCSEGVALRQAILEERLTPELLEQIARLGAERDAYLKGFRERYAALEREYGAQACQAAVEKLRREQAEAR